MTDYFLFFILGSGAMALLIIILGPPTQFLWHSLSEGLDAVASNYHEYWLWQWFMGTSQRQARQARRAFAAWFAGHVGGSTASVSDDEMLMAQELTPTIRQLLEEEVPAAIRRCNLLHRRTALLAHAVHMREIAIEPECAAVRHWTVLLLEQTNQSLSQYPLSLKIDAEELLDASVVVRRSLLPTCSRCPYIRKTVADAGEWCPASQLIGLDKKKC